MASGMVAMMTEAIADNLTGPPATDPAGLPRQGRNIATNLVALGALAALVALIGFLLTDDYFSRVAHQQQMVDSHRRDVADRAAGLECFFAERKYDMMNLAADRAVTAYFESQDLGMTPEYGLWVSLDDVQQCLLQPIRSKKVYGEGIYDRILLAAADRRVIAEAAAADAPALPPEAWKDLYRPGEEEPWIAAVAWGGAFRTVAAVPYRFRGRHIGHVIAMLRNEAVLAHLKRDDARGVGHLLFGP